MKILEVLKKDFEVINKHVNEEAMVKDVLYYLWNKYYRAASLAAVQDDDVSWNDLSHKSLDYLLERFLKAE